MQKLAILLLLGICFYQQHELSRLVTINKLIITDLQVSAMVLNDTAWSVPPDPCVPCDDALYNLAHPREQ